MSFHRTHARGLRLAVVAALVAACGGSGSDDPTGGSGHADDAGSGADGAAPDASTADASTEEAAAEGGAPDLARLDPPPAGAGVQLATGESTVASGSEVDDCWFFQVRDLAAAGGLEASAPLHVHRVQIAQREGSHATRIFRVRTVVGLGPENGAHQSATNGAGACADASNWADWPLVANSQVAGMLDWTYPDGVANVFEPHEWVMVQAHWANGESQKTPGPARATVNFWTIAANAVTAELGTILASKRSIRACQSNPTPTFEGSCQVNAATPVTIVGANGHTNGRGTSFDMFTWDGVSTTTPPVAQRFYASTQWDAPPMLQSPALAVQVPANGGVFYTCSYAWKTPPAAVGCAGLDAYDQSTWWTPSDKLDCCYTSGGLVDENEQCDAYVYYYPKQDNVNCF